MRSATPALLICLTICCIWAGNATAQGGTGTFMPAEASEDTGKYTFYYSAGKDYYDHGINDSALANFYTSLAYAEKARQPERICEALLFISRCLIHQGRQEEVLKELFRSITVSEQYHLPRQTAMARYLLSIVYDYQKRYAESLRYAKEAAQLFRAQKDTAGLIRLYPALITALGKNGDTAGVSVSFRSSLLLFRSFGRQASPAVLEQMHFSLQIMSLLFNASNFMKAEEDLAMVFAEIKALEPVIMAADNDYERFCWNTLAAMVSLKQKQYKEARRYADTALQLIHPESGNYERMADMYQVLSESSAALGEYERAYQAQLLFMQYNDSVFRQHTQEAVQMVEARYKTAEKEQQIVILRREKRGQRYLMIAAGAGLLVVLILLLVVIRNNRLRQKLLISKAEASRAELEQKALRAQMNPHFIFNSLNSVQRYVITRDIGGANTYLSAFASLIRQTLANSEKPLIRLSDEVIYLSTYLEVEQMRTKGEFTFAIEVAADIDQQTCFIPCMLIQPLVENAVLHGMAGKKENGHINVSVSRRHEQLIVVVEDNGPGLKNTASPLTHKGIALDIIQKRIDFINRHQAAPISFRMENGVTGEGTKVTLGFPVNFDQ